MAESRLDPRPDGSRLARKGPDRACDRVELKLASDDDSGPPSTAGDLLGLYLEKRANLVRFFAARLGARAAAEDLAQDLYLKIAALPADEPVQNPNALLYQMGANLMLDRMRQDRRAAAREGAWRETVTVRIGAEDIQDEPAVDDAIGDRQRLAQLIAGLQDLPPRMRQAFQLHKLQGLSHAETARAMGVSVSAVEKHISGALKTLLARLG